MAWLLKNEARVGASGLTFNTRIDLLESPGFWNA